MRREEWMKVNEWEEWKFPAMRIKRRTDQWGWIGVEEQAWCPGTWWGGKITGSEWGCSKEESSS